MAEQAHNMNPATTNEPRKPRRAAANAPTAGPSTWPSVIPDCMDAMPLRTSPPERPAMMKANLTWDMPTLEVYLAGPQKKVPGTKMGFPGFSDPQDQADALAYLVTLK